MASLLKRRCNRRAPLAGRLRNSGFPRGRRIEVAVVRPLGAQGVAGVPEPQIILKTYERNLVLELGARGNSSSSQAVWTETVFHQGDKLDVTVKNAPWVMTHLPAGPGPEPAPVEHYLPME